jgi:hypothetical protein
VTVSAELAEIRDWWAKRSQPTMQMLTSRAWPIAGNADDQVTPTGIENPYWDVVRQLPSVDSGRACVTPDGYARGLPVGRHLLTRRYSWGIPSPGDIAWLVEVLERRGLMEIGAGSGYWAWQARQAGIDVIAYEPADPADNDYTDGVEYVTTRRSGHSATSRHPDRALLVCWPTQGAAWAAQALSGYAGDLLIYVGEGRSGHCADDAFFRLLQRHWTAIGSSPQHVTWRHANCEMTAYRRTGRPLN